MKPARYVPGRLAARNVWVVGLGGGAGLRRCVDVVVGMVVCIRVAYQFLRRGAPSDPLLIRSILVSVMTPRTDTYIILLMPRSEK